MVQRREGDWECPDCGELVFASRETCFKCDRAAGKGGGKRREGDWDCPDCGRLIFASKDFCVFCERSANGGGSSRPGDWDCPNCGELVFASKVACFKCGTPKPSKAASSGPTASQVTGSPSGVSPSDHIKALAKLSPKFKKAWITYCKSMGESSSDPAKCKGAFITQFIEYAGERVQADLDSANAADAEEEEEKEEAPAISAPTPQKRPLAGLASVAAKKKKLTLKKSVLDEINRLNTECELQSQIRAGAVAGSLGELDAESALKILALLEEQQEEVEDPNAFICEQAQQAL